MMAPAAQDYKAVHQMAVATARMIRDGENVIVGIGLPLIAAAIAGAQHAPNSTILFEGGMIGARSRRMPWSISDSACSDNALAALEVWRVLGDQQAGYIHVGVVGGAQVDRYGNLNSTVILGRGSYSYPKVRMPGSGGSNDIASSCGRTIIMMRLRKNNFVSKVDFVTSPGFLSGGDS
ncbi:MAG: glutaconate CoA-transferase, partial [Deltaproteobacteria bacterium]